MSKDCNITSALFDAMNAFARPGYDSAGSPFTITQRREDDYVHRLVRHTFSVEWTYQQEVSEMLLRDEYDAEWIRSEVKASARRALLRHVYGDLLRVLEEMREDVYRNDAPALLDKLDRLRQQLYGG
jgi:hypothetical protein